MHGQKEKNRYDDAVNIAAPAIAFLCCTPALHAQWKVATVHMSEVFHHSPEAVACREQVNQKKIQLAQDVRAKAMAEKREEIKNLNLEGRQIMLDYQMRKNKDDTGPEAERVREYRKRRNLAESQLQALTLEFQDFQKEQMQQINQEMARNYRKILNRLTDLAREHAAQRGFDALYDVSGSSHVGLPPLLYAKPGLTTDLTAELRKMVESGKLPAGDQR